MDDLSKSYQLLGLEKGCTFEEVKQTYRDLVNVWHPDRFSHDERLKTVAQEKLKDINGAFELLKASFFESSILAPAGQPDGREAPVEETEPAVAGAKRGPWLWVILALLLAGTAGGGLFYFQKHPRVLSGSGSNGAASVDDKSDDSPVKGTDVTLNSLTAKEAMSGWRLLFNGKDLDGWRSFRAKNARKGWQVKNGAIVCVDKKVAGDLVTKDEYASFELQLDYKIEKGGKSGLLYHVTSDGKRVWETGPEMQIKDNETADATQLTGWLYDLYRPSVDPKTEKPLDSTKPAGDWNHVRLLVTPARCEHEINGVKYFSYVLGSADFNDRVAKSKFAGMKFFAKADSGFIALEADKVSFRNIKLREISSK